MGGGAHGDQRSDDPGKIPACTQVTPPPGPGVDGESGGEAGQAESGAEEGAPPNAAQREGRGRGPGEKGGARVLIVQY